MKRTLFIIMILVGSVNLYAQTVNDVLIKDLDVEYVQIVGTAKKLE